MSAHASNRFLPALLFFLLWSHPVQADCYRIATSAGTGATGEIARIARHVFEKAGFCVEIIWAPARRIDMMLAEHQVDGWAQAVTDDSRPDGVIFLPTNLGRLEGTLYWPSDAPEPKGEGVSIGTVVGVAWAQEAIRKRGSSLFEVNDNKQLLAMAANRRIQGFLLPEITYRHFLSRFPQLRSYRSRKVADLPIRLALRADLTPISGQLEVAVRQTFEEEFPKQVWQRYLDELHPDAAAAPP